MRESSSASWCARHSVSVTTAAFDEAYTPALGMATMPPSGDEVLTTWPSSPCSTMCGMNTLRPLTTPKTLTSKVQRQSFGVFSQSCGSAGGPTPALLHSTWMLPNRSRAASLSACTEAMSVTSVRTPMASAPPATRASVASASAPGSMSASTTRMPSAANRSTMARPMPLAAPVTTAVRPVSASTCSPFETFSC